MKHCIFRTRFQGGRSSQKENYTCEQKERAIVNDKTPQDYHDWSWLEMLSFVRWRKGFLQLRASARVRPLIQ